MAKGSFLNLLNDQSLCIKVWGNTKWPYRQYVGKLKSDLVKDAISSCSLSLYSDLFSDFSWALQVFSCGKPCFMYKSKASCDLLGASNAVVKFEIDPLAATASGELTSLVYKCEELNKEGLILGFYGDYWNDAGVVYQGYGFKNLPKEKALELLQKLEEAKENFNKYLSDDTDNNNIYFTYDDLTFLIYKSTETRIRVFWKTFYGNGKLLRIEESKEG